MQITLKIGKGIYLSLHQTQDTIPSFFLVLLSIQITSVSVSIHLYIIFRGHKILTDTHKWGSTAHGYFWKSGDLPVCSLPSPLLPPRLPLSSCQVIYSYQGSLVPYATLLTGAYHLLTMVCSPYVSFSFFFMYLISLF